MGKREEIQKDIPAHICTSIYVFIKSVRLTCLAVSFRFCHMLAIIGIIALGGVSGWAARTSDCTSCKNSIYAVFGCLNRKSDKLGKVCCTFTNGDEDPHY